MLLKTLFKKWLNLYLYLSWDLVFFSTSY
jgi:hypothetical protein